MFDLTDDSSIKDLGTTQSKRVISILHPNTRTP
jgi:hypothetical protein